MKSIYVLGLFLFIPSQLLGQKAIECQSIGQSRIESIDGAFVEVDIPKNAKRKDAFFMVREVKIAVPWTKCAENSNCAGHNWPDLQHPGADLDGSLHYAAVAKASTVDIGMGVQKIRVEDIRLVVTYTMPGPYCTTQATFHKKAGSAEARWIFMPAGKAMTTFRTWYRQEPAWTICDFFDGPRNGCVPMGITFDSASQTDDGDQASGWWFKCRDNYPNGSGTPNVYVEGFCRVELIYKP